MKNVIENLPRLMEREVGKLTGTPCSVHLTQIIKEGEFIVETRGYLWVHYATGAMEFELAVEGNHHERQYLIAVERGWDWVGAMRDGKVIAINCDILKYMSSFIVAQS